MTPEERARLTAEGLPEWVSDSQWSSQPSIAVWQGAERMMRSLAQSKPVTWEYAKAQAERINK